MNNTPYGISVPAYIPTGILQQGIGIYKIDEEEEKVVLLSYEETVELNLRLEGEHVVWNSEKQVIELPLDAKPADTYIVQLIETTYDPETLEPIETVLNTVAVRLVEGTPIPPVTPANIEIHSLRDIIGIDIDTGEVIKDKKFFFPLTHIKAVIDDHGCSLYSILGRIQDNLNNAVAQINNRIDQMLSNEVRVESLEIVPESLVLGIGKSSKPINTKMLPIFATNKVVVWETDDENIATVNSGVVRGISKGQAIITCKTTDGSDLEATCIVDVKVIVTSIIMSSQYTLNKNTTIPTDATVLPEEADDKTLKYVMDDESIATVDDGGNITGITDGSTIMYVTAKDGGGATTSCLVTVGEVIPVTDIVIDDTIELAVGETKQISSTVIPANASNKVLRWTSSNSSVASVDSTGNVTGLSAGPVVITAETTDGTLISKQCTINVTSDVIYYGISSHSNTCPANASELQAQKKVLYASPKVTLPATPVGDYRTLWIAIPDDLSIESWKETVFSSDIDYYTSPTKITVDGKEYTVFYDTSDVLISGTNDEITIIKN